MNTLRFAVIILGLPVIASAVVCTSAASGNWTDQTTWGAGGTGCAGAFGFGATTGIPGIGDRVAITTGKTVTVQAGETIITGSSVATLGGAHINVNAGGILNVNGTLQVRGFNRTSGCTAASDMAVCNSGTINFNGGSSLVFDFVSDGQSWFENRGVLNLIGTAGNRVTVTNVNDATRRNWNVSGTSTSLAIGAPYDYTRLIRVVSLSAAQGYWISNAAGTGPGSFGDSSIVITARNPGTILLTEVATYDAVLAVGDYWVDYNAGMLFLRTVDALGTPTFSATWKKLAYMGGNIQTTQVTAGHKIIVRFTDFRYAGTNTLADSTLSVSNRVAGEFEVTDSTFTNSYRPILLFTNNNATVGNPFLIMRNEFDVSQDPATNYSPSAVSIYTGNQSHFRIENNYFHGRGFGVKTSCGAAQTATGLIVRYNVFDGVTYGVVNTYGNDCVWAGADVSLNIIRGWGAATDGRAVGGLAGSLGSRSSLNKNILLRSLRAVNYNSNSDTVNNVMLFEHHHGISGPTQALVAISNATIKNNVLAGGRGADGLALGYEAGIEYINVAATNNVFYDYTGALLFDYGNKGDSGGLGTHPVTRAQIHSNIFANSTVSGGAMSRTSDTATANQKLHISHMDHNLFHAIAGSNYVSLTRGATFFLTPGADYNLAAARNATGISIHSPSYATTQAATHSLELIRTSATNVTVAWDGGTPVQLYVPLTGLYSGAVSTASNLVSAFTSLAKFADAGAAWPTAFNSVTPPAHAGMWMVITGGTGAGQIRRVTARVTATETYVTEPWTTVPDATSTYALYQSEVVLTSGTDAGTVRIGIDWRNIPAALGTYTDTGIGMSINDSSLNPLFVDPTRNLNTFAVAKGFIPASETGLFVQLKAEALTGKHELLEDLHRYLWEGYQPSNPAVWAQGYLSSEIGPGPNIVQRAAGAASSAH